MEYDSDDSGLEQLDHESDHPPLYVNYHITNQEPPSAYKGLTKLGHYIAHALGESETAIFVKATHVLGRERALYSLEYALRSQHKHSGYVIKSGQRVRTLGGMFLRHVKDDPNNDHAMLRQIFKRPSKTEKARKVWAKRRLVRNQASKSEMSALYDEWLTLTDEFETYSSKHYPDATNSDHSVSESDNDREPSIRGDPAEEKSFQESSNNSIEETEESTKQQRFLDVHSLYEHLPESRRPFFLQLRRRANQKN